MFGALLATLTVSGVQVPPLPADGFATEVKYTQVVPIRAIVNLPDGYANEPKKRWPLILFLHGSGERGEDVEKVRVHGPAKEIAKGRKLPFIVVSPQCPEDQGWDVKALAKLLDVLEKKYRVDRSRIYLTGLSMGGYGTWGLAIEQPTRFAAIAPICGGGNPRKVGVLKAVPTWVTHGDADGAVPIAMDREMVEALRAAGGDVRFDVIAGGGHDVWTDVYAGNGLYEWFLSKRLP